MEKINIEELWSRILDTVFSSLDEQTKEIWISPILPKSISEKEFIISVPNKYFSDWFISNGYKSIVEELILSMYNLPVEIKFEYTMDIESFKTEQPKIDFEYIPEKVFTLSQAFNPDYTFEEFITDESNRFAKAVCETAAREPGITYNPIFIYSPVGLGKTHLLHAIGNRMLQMSKKFRIAYINANKFVEEYINAIQTNKLDVFRSKFQNAIALLLDDVHFLIGKEKSQEEFFYIFNLLFDNKKQIVITSDRKPQDLKGIEERLINRFEWGVIADIGKPSLELRLAILRHKAKKQRIFVPDDVLRYIAENVTENVRKLEGALLGVVARALIENVPLTIDVVKEMLKHITEGEQQTVDIEKIIAVVEEEFRIPKKELLSKKRTEALSLPRQIGMYLAKILTDLSYAEISEKFGRKDHTTSYHAYLKIKNLVATNPYYSQLINKMIAKIKE